MKKECPEDKIKDKQFLALDTAQYIRSLKGIKLTRLGCTGDGIFSDFFLEFLIKVSIEVKVAPSNVYVCYCRRSNKKGVLFRYYFNDTFADFYIDPEGAQFYGIRDLEKRKMKLDELIPFINNMFLWNKITQSFNNHK